MSKMMDHVILDHLVNMVEHTKGQQDLVRTPLPPSQAKMTASLKLNLYPWLL